MTELPFIVFDVNETLLDLESLAPAFERIFGVRSALRSWFAQLILYSEALTLAGTYVPFTDIGGAVLKMVATTRGISISAADRAEFDGEVCVNAAAPGSTGRASEIERRRFPAFHADRQHGRDFRATAQASRPVGYLRPLGKCARSAVHARPGASGCPPGFRPLESQPGPAPGRGPVIRRRDRACSGRARSGRLRLH